MEEGDGDDFVDVNFDNIEKEGGNDEQFLRNEAISAVADEGLFVEEEEDYEDLYNDVNVGEGVFQSFHSNNIVNDHQEEQLGFKNQEDKKKIDDVGGNQDLGFRGNGNQEPQPPEGVGRGKSGGVGDGGGMRVELGEPSGGMGETEGQVGNNTMPPQGVMQQSHGVGSNEGFARQGGFNGGGGGYGVGNNGNGNGNGVGSGGGTMLFIGELHWWTTDAQVEAELCKYGSLREVIFFVEKASGKSKGYCQAEFNDPSAAAACKERVNGHLFNGRACVVQYASPYSIKRLGDAQVNKNQAFAQSNTNVPPGRRGFADGGGRGGGNNMPIGGGYQGEGNRGYGRTNWGRGQGPGMGGRGQGPRMPGRSGGRGIMGNANGNGFGQGLGPNPQMMHPQTMMGQGFDPAYGPNMGRLGGYGGFPAAPTPPFPNMLSSFPPVGGVAMPGVAPHVNPAFFGRCMPPNGMGMMPSNGMDGHGMGMWSDPGANGWGGEDPGGRVAESSYGDDPVSDHQYGDASHDRGGRPSAIREKDRASERDWCGPPSRKYRDDRDPGLDMDVPREKDGHDHDWSERRPHDDRELSRERERPRERERDREREREPERERDRDRDRYKEDRDRDRYREDRDRHVDHHRYKDRGTEYESVDRHSHKDYGLEYDDEWERGRSSRAYSKSRLSHDEDHRGRSREAEYSKRRRLPSE